MDKVWVPLENNPEVMNPYLEKCGMPSNYGFTEVLNNLFPDIDKDRSLHGGNGIYVVMIMHTRPTRARRENMFQCTRENKKERNWKN